MRLCTPHLTKGGALLAVPPSTLHSKKMIVCEGTVSIEKATIIFFPLFTTLTGALLCTPPSEQHCGPSTGNDESLRNKGGGGRRGSAGGVSRRKEREQRDSSFSQLLCPATHDPSTVG